MRRFKDTPRVRRTNDYSASVLLIVKLMYTEPNITVNRLRPVLYKHALRENDREEF